MHIMVTGLIASLVFVAGCAYGDGCDGPFGAKKSYSCERAKCMSFTPPEELQGIRHGGYTEYVGMFINDGRAIWCGFDLDAREVIRVDRYAGRKLSSAPEVGVQTTNHYQRQSGEKNKKIVDVVTRRKISKAELADLICLSNELWASMEDHMSVATDVHNAVVLLDGDEGRMFGGPGVLTGSAARLEKMLCTTTQAKGTL